MAKHTGRHGARRSRFGGVAVFIVVALSGYLLMTNVRVNRTSIVTSDTSQLVEQRVNHVNKLQKEVKELSSQIETLNKISGGTGDDAANGSGTDTDADSGTVIPAVKGPGITVTLDDSPLWENAVGSSGSSANINDYVIHQQDIEAVVNALWAGGAEAMMIQDQRVLFNSAIRCQGNILMLQGKNYSPPYTVSAIGDPDTLKSALDSSQAIVTYKEYVRAYGLGWDVETKESQKFPNAALTQSLRYASVANSEETNAQ